MEPTCLIIAAAAICNLTRLVIARRALAIADQPARQPTIFFKRPTKVAPICVFV
jgi:hypothetical protein